MVKMVLIQIEESSHYFIFNSFYPAPEGTSCALVCPTNLLTAILRE